MHAWMDGGDWIWMSLMMAFWVVLIGAVVFVAVRLAIGGGRRRYP